ncbi:MAG: FAD-binding oxidoreductase [Proteobacteria bacterium]|nr:FAD-binding oxidoreductase [Pseudomonadota bacterium]
MACSAGELNCQGSGPVKQSKVTRRTFVKGLAAAAGTSLAPRGTWAHGTLTTLNDASRLSLTPVAKHWVVAADEDAMFVDALRRELKEAAAAKRPVAVGAARHTMGGQSLARDGVNVSLGLTRVEPDTRAKIFRVNAGARWHQVIGRIDGLGFSPAVMQSNADFGVASTFSVNAHGWPVPYGPFGSTVKAIKLMLADGTILTCSRTENADLFNLAMGGYGLLGVVLELDVDMVANEMLAPTFELMPAAQFGRKFVETIEGGGVTMAYGRLSVAKSNFLEQALMVTFRPTAVPAAGLPRATAGGLTSSLSRKVYRAQVGSENYKKLRWHLETAIAPKLAGAWTRNSLMNEPVSNLASSDSSRTDILHEYFVSPETFPEFVTICQKAILASKQEFLNVTLRYLARDTESVLAHSPVRRIAAVMSFSQAMTPEAETDMQKLTEALIDGVSGIGGAFYLPYRLHARRDQVRACYPKTAEFIAGKNKYDPNGLFKNAMWNAYFAS